MINNFNKKVINAFVVLILGIQCSIYFLNQKPLTETFVQKTMTVENFSSIVLSNSGITKIGSDKFNKIDENVIYLEGKSYLENKEYKIYGKNISIDLSREISDIIGRIVLSDKMELSAGTHQFEWDASKLSSGIYFIRLSYGTHIKTQKALLVK